MNREGNCSFFDRYMYNKFKEIVMEGAGKPMRETVLGDIEVAVSELQKIAREQREKLESIESFLCSPIPKPDCEKDKEPAHNGFLSNTLWGLKGLRELIMENGSVIQRINVVSKQLEEPAP